MSLTNPNTPVSQQDLQDFYHKLLPYMGGSFGMIANKFSKGDMYSTDEKMIGQWIDGKPLYQRSVSVPSNVTLSSSSTFVDVVAFDTTGCVPKNIVLLRNDGSENLYCGDISYFVGADTNGNIKARTAFGQTTIFAGTVLTVQYTKTTDSAISIGDDTDYSTTEKIVGTWIDGKPIYQVTVQNTLPNCSTNGTSASKNITLANVDTFVGYQLHMQGNTYQATLPLYEGDKPENSVRGYYSTTYTAFVLRNSVKNYNGLPVDITLQYTKTTE